MLGKLKEYKEIIAIVVFFLGGLTWLHKEFPDKKDVESQQQHLQANLKSQKRALEARLASLQCLVDKYMQLTQLQIQNATLAKDIDTLETARDTTNANGHGDVQLSPELKHQFAAMMQDLANKTARWNANDAEMQKVSDQLQRNVCMKVTS